MPEGRGQPRIILVGAGAMGARHARVVARSGIADLAAVVDPREEIGRSIAEQFGSTWFRSLDEVDDADGVVIAAATEAHRPLALQVIARGMPLLVEKPITDGLEQTVEILTASESANVPLMCGFVERFNPAVITARSMVVAPIHISATRHSPYADRIRTGVAWDLLVHDIDLVVNLFQGTPSEVVGLVGVFDRRSLAAAEDVAEVLLRFPGGGIGHISSSRVSQRKVRSLWIHEIDKLVEVDLLRRNVTIFRNVADRAANDEGRGYRQETIIEIPEIVSSAEPLAAQFEHFVGLIRGDIDADLERASIAGSHGVIERLLG